MTDTDTALPDRQSRDDREQRIRFIWETYGQILNGRAILDVGADECRLKRYLDADSTYWGIGLGGCPDETVDLDRNGIPCGDGTYDIVLCLDVLEHLENIHRTFDELCRVSRRHVLISLPNPLGGLLTRLTRFPEYAPGRLAKFYGLPAEPPEDRHRWFFDVDEAERFVRVRAAHNNMAIEEMTFRAFDMGKRRRLGRMKDWATQRLLRKELRGRRTTPGTLWVLLVKESYRR